jgi:Bacterial regulatory protein, arsR family
MGNNDRDLFNRLRQAGLRKQVAKRLSGIGDSASSKAVGAARGAVGELRSLADEIERRLPTAAPDASAPGKSAGRVTDRSPTATPQAPRSNAAGATAGRRAQRKATQRKRAPAPKPAAAATTNGARAPRGQNKAQILEALKAGPKTASEISTETGIATATVGSTLSKLASAGEVVKADRGYGLPQ